MGQSAIIYRVSTDNFDLLKKSKNRKEYRLSELSKEYSNFQGSFMGIEFILAKNQDEETKQTLFEIFSPSNSLGIDDDEYESLDEYERYEFIESGNYIPFLDNQKVAQINDILQNVTEKDVVERYSSAELNSNGIYPSVWHDDNSENMAYNLREILEYINEIKKIFRLAVENEDYLLSIIG